MGLQSWEELRETLLKVTPQKTRSRVIHSLQVHIRWWFRGIRTTTWLSSWPWACWLGWLPGRPCAPSSGCPSCSAKRAPPDPQCTTPQRALPNPVQIRGGLDSKSLEHEELLLLFLCVSRCYLFLMYFSNEMAPTVIFF